MDRTARDKAGTSCTLVKPAKSREARMASSLFTDNSCLLLVEVQPLLRGVLYRAVKAQSKGEKGQFPFPADCPHLYFCLRSAMRVGTETKHKDQTGNWPKL